MYTLVIGNKNYSSWSLRPWALMRALGIPFAERLLPFGDERVWVPFRAEGGSGKVPCLVDGDRRVWDSLAITEYLAERHPGVWPDDQDARAWARCAAAEMHSGFGALRSQCSMDCGVRVRLHVKTPALLSDLHRVDALWQQGLRQFGGPFLAGARFSAVDAFYAPVVFRLQTYGLPISRPSEAYAQRLVAHPVLSEWYDSALGEPWRDEPHDREVTNAGVVIEDLRSERFAGDHPM